MAGIGIWAEADEALYIKAKAVLDPKQFRQAGFQVVKRSTDKGTTIVRREVRKKTPIDDKHMKRAVKTRLELRGNDPPIGYVKISHEPIPAVAFKPTGPGMFASGGRDKGGIRFKAWKDRPARVFRRGFRTQLKSGHIGVFIRTKAVGKGSRRSKKTGYAKRLPIKELLGPSVEGVVRLMEVGKKVFDGLVGEMDKQWASQINRFTKK